MSKNNFPMIARSAWYAARVHLDW